MMTPNRFRRFTREEWAALRSNPSLSLPHRDLAPLRNTCEHFSLSEVTEMYLPLSCFLHLHVKAAQSLSLVRGAFLERHPIPHPFVIAISGSVAVGKSTFAAVLRAILARWTDYPAIALVTTDSFLYPNAVLEQRGLTSRKGFPESYDLPRLINFLAALKAGEREIEIPVYSHLTYDILPQERQMIGHPDILVLEGLNVLQISHGAASIPSDFIDFSLYIDADEVDIEQWYIERFLHLQTIAFQQPLSYFHRYRSLPESEARQLASSIWRAINLINLRENIQPTRQRADLVLCKNPDHSMKEVWLRQICKLKGN